MRSVTSNGMWRVGVFVVALALGLSSCAADPAPTAAVCEVRVGKSLAPASGVLSGVNPDWEHETLQEYSDNLGRRPAVVVSFAAFPFSAEGTTNVKAAYEQVRAEGGILLLTLEPRAGLAAVTSQASDDLATTLDGFNKAGVPVIVRFAHEMNGSWYEWGQQPAEYKAAFRLVADSIHRLAQGSATMWAPKLRRRLPLRWRQVPGRRGHAGLRRTRHERGRERHRR